MGNLLQNFARLSRVPVVYLCIFVKLVNIITHEENTKEIMSVKEFVYLIQNHVDLHKI
jgi:hypothetical protein